MTHAQLIGINELKMEENKGWSKLKSSKIRKSMSDMWTALRNSV
jgi:hypothetical protein